MWSLIFEILAVAIARPSFVKIFHKGTLLSRLHNNGVIFVCCVYTTHYTKLCLYIVALFCLILLLLFLMHLKINFAGAYRPMCLQPNSMSVARPSAISKAE